MHTLLSGWQWTAAQQVSWGGLSSWRVPGLSWGAGRWTHQQSGDGFADESDGICEWSPESAPSACCEGPRDGRELESKGEPSEGPACDTAPGYALRALRIPAGHCNYLEQARDFEVG